MVQFPILDPVSVGLFPGRVNMTWPILGPGVSYLQKLTWSGLYRLDPIVSFPPWSDLVYSSRLGSVSVWFLYPEILLPVCSRDQGPDVV